MANSQTIGTSVPKTPILIVDDRVDNIKVLSLLLESYAYSVSYALSAQQAFERLEHLKPALILLDLFMPGIDGLELCEILKSNPKYQDIPIIFLTASQERDHILKAFEKGASDYIMKPFNSKEVLVRVLVHIKLRQQEVALRQTEGKLHAIASHVEDGLLVVDRGGIIQFANDATAKMLETPASELLGRAIDTLALQPSAGEESEESGVTVRDIVWEDEPATMWCLRRDRYSVA